MVTICKTPYIYMTAHLEHSNKTFRLPHLSIMSKENGCHVNIVCGSTHEMSVTFIHRLQYLYEASQWNI